MKKIVTVLLLFVFHTAVFALSATGYGETPKEAKDAALSELSNIVVANVKSKLSSSTTVTGEKVVRDAKKELEVSSTSYFQGVVYSDAVKGSQGYEVTATLDREATANTLRYIKKELNKDLSKLSKNELQKLLKMSEIGYALANFTSIKTVHQEEIKAREDEVLTYLSYGQIFFHIKPADAELTIDDKVYKPFTNYLLPAKSYTYTIRREGYHTEEGKFYLNSAKKRDVTVSLVKRSSAHPEIYLDIDASLEASAKEVLTKYKVDVTDNPKSTNAIKFTFKQDFVTQIDEMKVYNLTVVAEAFKGRKSVILKRAKIKNVTDGNIEAKKAKGVAALTNALLKKLDMKSFQGKELVDYSKR